ncbi:MAG TPA: peptidoglycan-binding domain-containing protein [Steroidobacteraceae bacterium]
MRALILGLSVLAIVASTPIAEAGLTTTLREASTSVDATTTPGEANQETEDSIGLTKAKRREIQRGLTRLGFDTKANGKFGDSTRVAITGWQEEHGYPETGFLDAAQNTALLDESMAVSKSDDQSASRRGRSRRSRGIGGPIGAIGHVVGGLFRR